MGLMKINQILKKYKKLHQKHKNSWEDSQKRIRAASKKIAEKMNDPEKIFICEKTYKLESYNYHIRGNKLLDDFMTELKEQEIFPKKGDSRNKL